MDLLTKWKGNNMRNKEIEEAIETYKKLHEEIKFTDKDYKEAIEEAKKQIEYHRNLNGVCCFMTDSTTLKALLSLIEKQQGENKYLRDENNIYRNETVSKYKIRNKIKELENMRDTSITSGAFNIFNGEIIVLQGLLGE